MNRNRNHHHRARSANKRGHSRRQRESGQGREPLGYGRNFLKEVLRHAPERIQQIYALPPPAVSSRDTQVRDALRDEIRARGLPLVELAPEALTQLAGSDAHQGFVVSLKTPPSRPSLKEFLAAFAGEAPSVLIMLDSIEDPHNLGAIIRACECFKIDAVILSSNRGTGLTPAARKASVGASELVEIIEVSNLVEAARRCKESGYWCIAAEARAGSVSLTKYEFPSRVLIIMGAEGTGLHTLLRETADFSVRIDIGGKIDSLNVSQASAVLLHEYRRHFPL